MSLLSLTRLTTDLGHQPELRAGLLAAPADTLAAYPLTDEERAAVLALDAHTLLALGLHPVVMRNLLVRLGVGNHELFDHQHTLRPGS
jgi:hypothetical protein